MTPTRRRLEHAAGYLALGMLNEATQELALIPFEDAALPDVLSARLALHMAKHEWRAVVDFGSQLARCNPEKEDGWINWAYALRELNRVEEAKAVLLEAESVHGKKCGVLHYNLACYHCLLGDMTEAKRRLRIACKMDAGWKKAALDDPDLKAMRDTIATMK